MSQRGPEYAREWQREPVRARVAVTESQRETGREPVRARERARKGLREQVRAKGLQKRG